MSDIAKAPPAPERMHALDAVRGFALLLGIVFHATLSFLPSKVPLWAIMDSQRSATLGVVFFATHVFRMTTFFLIAGFFAHMSFHKKGAKGFVADRLKRIALPLIVAWPFLFAGILAATIWGVIVMNGGHLPKGPSPTWPRFPAFPLTHLWFLYVLLEFYAATLILRGALAALDRQGRVRAGIDRLVALLTQSALAPIVLAMPLSLVLATAPHWRAWFGIPTPDDSFVTNPAALTGFSLAFGFGWALHRQPDLLRALERRWALNLALAIAAISVCLRVIGVTPQVYPITDPARHLAAAIAYPIASWTSTFALIGAALRFLPGYSPTRRYIADASYWLYLIHMPIVMALQVVVSRLDWPWPVKFVGLLAVAFALMFASYQLLVRYSFIGAILNGRRAPRDKAKRLPTRPTSSTPGEGLKEALP